MSGERDFHIGDILSVTTGKLVSPRLIEGVYDGDAVEAMQDPFRIGDARGKLAKLCDYLEGADG